MSLWLLILLGQIMITQFGGRVFVVSPAGLDFKQWALSVLISLSGILVNLVLKVVPDWWCPRLGHDSADDRRKEAKARKRYNM